MKSAKTMKRAFGMSVVAIILSIAMLTGTTLAWFTDSEVSGMNQIIAGNLDIEVEYCNTGDDWQPIDGSDSLFKKDALWEPGHTEIVNLKITNKGTLALYYATKVSPVNETGGINVYDRSFKLSDYLVFGTTRPNTDGKIYTQDDAGRAEAISDITGATQGLNQTLLTQEKPLEPGETEYVTLVVYMPITVDNNANYKTGTTVPKIELGITVLATQYESEEDSFNNEYDTNAKTDTAYADNGPTYDYFEQATESANVSRNDATGAVLADVTVESKQEINNVSMVTVNVPKEAVAADANQISLNVTKTTAPAGIIVDSETATSAYEIKVEGIDGVTPVTVKLMVGKDLVNVKLYHHATEVNSSDYSYDPTTGILTFTSATFSPFTVAYKAEASITHNDGTVTTYGTLAAAIRDVKAGETITILKDFENGGIDVAGANKEFTIDFNGYTYTILDPLVGSANTKTNGFRFLKENTVTLMNGVIESEVAKILIQNYSNLTFKNMVLNGSDVTQYVLSNNNGVTTIEDTTINAIGSNIAFDVCRYASYPNVHVTVKGNSVINGNVEVSSSNTTGNKDNFSLTVEGGTFNGNLVYGDNGAYCTINDPDGKFGSSTVVADATALKEEIEKAADGATIFINAGTYNLPSQIQIDNKSITIIGNGEVTLNGTSQGNHVFQLRNGYVNGVKNSAAAKTDMIVNIQNVNIGGSYKSGIMVRNDIDLNLDDVNISGNPKWSYLQVENSYDDECADKIANIDVKNSTITKVSMEAGTGHITYFNYADDCNFDILQVTNLGGDIYVNAEKADAGYTYWVDSVDEMQSAVNTVSAGDNYVILTADITDDVTVPQGENLKITIDGNGNTYAGAITIDGKSTRFETTATTIKNVNFKADTLSQGKDACINLGSQRYTNNVTVSDCTFDVPGKVGVKSYTGGDWNLTIDGCTAKAGMHSMAQLKNVEKGLTITDCEVYSKNGINLNNTPTATITGCNIDVTGYAVRFGADVDGTEDGYSKAVEEFVISNCTLAADCQGNGDAVIVFRNNALNAKLTLDRVAINGSPEYIDSENATIIIQ